MRKAGLLAAAGLLALSCAFVPAAAAVEPPNVLVMGEDADQDAVPRTSRVFERVVDTLSSQLHDRGFDVFDEAAVIKDDAARGTRRSDAEIVALARGATRPPIDVAVILTIYAGSERLSYTTRVDTRISGRLLNIRSGQRLGSFEVRSPRDWRAPAECPRECVLETVTRNGRILAQDLGAVLAEKLQALWAADRGGALTTAAADEPGLDNAYALVFDNFSPDDITVIEEYLVAFSGYRHLRPTYQSRTRHEYWYESDADSARLNRNLRKMLDHLDIRGRLTFSGEVFTIEKVTVRQ